MNSKAQATRVTLMRFTLPTIQTHLKGAAFMKSRRFWKKALVATAAIMLAALPAQGAVSTGNQGIAGGQGQLPDKHPAGQGHNEFAGEGNAGALHGHEHYDTRPLHQLIGSRDEVK